MIPKGEWIWMPHPGHLIVSRDCRFHLNTRVGKYLVSTVGEYLPEEGVRERLAEGRGKPLKGRGDERLQDWFKKHGYEDIGLNRKYETMVFNAIESENPCCPWRQADGHDIDFKGYNEPEDAYRGHLEMCERYAEKQE